MLEPVSGTLAFFKAMAPILTANLLTVAFVYCAARYSQKELRGEEGQITLLWPIILALLSALYGLYVWGVYPFGK